MGRPTGRADLPLHGGRVPPWLSQRMARLGRVVVEALLVHYGRAEVLRRLSHPFWFQSLGCVMGMDWHSSGITTSVIGALQKGLRPISGEIGLSVCGGRGKRSRATPSELCAVGERTGLDGAALARTSRLVAKVDNTAVQDGFQIYLHAFIVADDGAWVVVQQGMDPSVQTARRYHWLSEGISSFVEEPHAAIEGSGRGQIVNLVDRRAAAARQRSVAIAVDGPDRALSALREVRGAAAARQQSLALAGGASDCELSAREVRGAAPIPHLFMPEHHDVRPEDVVERRFHAALAAAAEAGPRDFESLLLVPGVGPRTLANIAMVAEVIHGAPSRFTDPARFSLAHGGKDGHPFPVPLTVYDATLRVYRQAIDAAHLGREEKLEAIRRLDREARRLERTAQGPGVAEYIQEERRRSPEYGGRTVYGPAGAELPYVERGEPVRSSRLGVVRTRAVAKRSLGALPSSSTTAPKRRAEPSKARRRAQLALPGFR